MIRTLKVLAPAALFVLLFQAYAFANDKPVDLKPIKEKLDTIISNQQQLISEIEALKQEIHKIKIRVSRQG